MLYYPWLCSKVFSTLTWIEMKRAEAQSGRWWCVLYDVHVVSAQQYTVATEGYWDGSSENKGTDSVT